MKKILVLFAHPAFHKSRINKQLIQQVEEIEGVTIHDLYEEYPNFHIDVKREQQLLLEHEIIIWHHPFYWYSAPSILKEWIDLVLEHNFAYGKEGNALKGKAVMSTITAGGRMDAYMEQGYNHYSINQLLYPFEQTSRLCKMDYLPPYVVHGTHLLKEKELDKCVTDYKKLITALRNDRYTADDFQQASYANDLIKD